MVWFLLIYFILLPFKFIFYIVSMIFIGSKKAYHIAFHSDMERKRLKHVKATSIGFVAFYEVHCPYSQGRNCPG